MTRNTSSGELGLVFTQKLNSHPTLAFFKSKEKWLIPREIQMWATPALEHRSRQLGRERSWSKHCLCPRAQLPYPGRAPGPHAASSQLVPGSPVCLQQDRDSKDGHQP